MFQNHNGFENKLTKKTYPNITAMAFSTSTL